MLLLALWVFIAFCWDEICDVTWWMFEDIIDSLCTTYLAKIWCWTSTSMCYVASMISVFTNSFHNGCTCHSSSICANGTGWCITYSNCFLILLITTIDIFCESINFENKFSIIYKDKSKLTPPINQRFKIIPFTYRTFNFL